MIVWLVIPFKGTGVDAFVYDFNATDRDEGKNGEIDLELTNSVGEVQDNPFFKLDRKTGVLTTKIDLDYETTKEYTVSMFGNVFK